MFPTEKHHTSFTKWDDVTKVSQTDLSWTMHDLLLIINKLDICPTELEAGVTVK